MRIRRIPGWLFFAIALLLHGALLAAIYVWNAQQTAKQASPPLKVSVIPLSIPTPAPVVEAPPAPVAPPVKPAARKIPKKKQAPPPKPKQKMPVQAPKAADPIQPERPIVPAPPVSSPVPTPAPAAPPAPVVQAPVKTGVSVSASYVAAETAKWYPTLSKRYEEQGTVVVRVHVSAEGRAEKVEVKKRSDYPLLDEAAIGLAKSLKYNPAKVDGSPVADWVEIPITFRLHNS
ncbi:energy transducer TonB [Oxalobacteraceae bacterium R-40]|uniref:Energy transducer TonB n=1 Tax=Keguizhuia sedimenti TaxID=3064264 RepID=A0ABU1BM17_9BURK|nr:energy transducer TonB [Oxalobacteraceae bacterium R-40]